MMIQTTAHVSMASFLLDLTPPQLSLFSSKSHFGFLTEPLVSAASTRKRSYEQLKPHHGLEPVRSHNAVGVFHRTLMNGSLEESGGEEITGVESVDDVHELGSCARLGSVESCCMYHSFVLKYGLNHDKFVVSKLLSMYARCGDLDSACKLFDGSPNVDVVTWNSLISGFASQELLEEALSLFTRILGDVGVRPNHYTFSIVFKVCGGLLATGEGRQIHGLAVKSRVLAESAVGNAALTMYGKFGMMKEADMVFQSHPNRNHVSWGAFLTCLYNNKCFEEALRHFFHMRQCDMTANGYAYTVALGSCGSLKLLGSGRSIHALVLKDGCGTGAFVGTAIIGMYSNCAEMGDAEKQVADMEASRPYSQASSWNALFAGYVSNDMNEAALGMFCRMLKSCVITCDQFTYSVILIACSSIPSLVTGEQIHGQVLKTKHDMNVHVGSSLIEMYTKCGNLTDAIQVFDQMRLKDTVLWNSTLKAYSYHGRSNQALEFFSKMVEEGIRPTGATFLAILSSCSHSGFVEQGLNIFNSMIRDYRITPEETHYSCIVDLLGRAGRLKEAREFIKNLPTEPSAAIWRPLLAACRRYGKLEMAEFAASRILEEDPHDPTVYVTLSNMYAQAGRLDDAVKQRILMTDREVKKEPGCSWIEVDRRVHTFFSKGITHPETIDIYDKLDELRSKSRDMGYSSTTNEEDDAMYHSERLAVSFGLMSLPPWEPVRVFKNLRICSTCHDTMKCVSEITKREIILRDNYRFHHFKHGSCSCGDYW